MADDNMTDASQAVELATELTIAWLGNPNTRIEADQVPVFLARMHGAVLELAGNGPAAAPVAMAVPDYTPAVSVRRSLASKDHIISMIDGKPYKALRRHLTTNGLTPDEYRQRYNLKADHPMVAETYSETRRAMAKKIGLGRKPGTKVATEKPKNAKTTKVAKAAAAARPSGE